MNVPSAKVNNHFKPVVQLFGVDITDISRMGPSQFNRRDGKE